MAFIGGTVLYILSVILNGLVLTKLWVWFIMPIFTINAITIIQALGLSITIRYLTRPIDLHKNNKDDIDWNTRIGVAIAYPLMILLVGWIFTLFM